MLSFDVKCNLCCAIGEKILKESIQNVNERLKHQILGCSKGLMQKILWENPLSHTKVLPFHSPISSILGCDR